MTNEEIERTIEFILKQQAQFTVNMQKLEEAQSKAEKRTDRLEGAFVGLVNLIGDTQRQTQAQITEIASALAETNERLNNFILVVERYVSGNQNGKSKS